MNVFNRALLRSRMDRDGEEGMTLIELMVAIFILAVAILAMAATAASSVRSVRVSRDRDVATSAASGALEAARAIEYDLLALNSSNSFAGDARVTGTPPTFAHDGTNNEPLTISNGGAIDSYTCTPADPAACSSWFPGYASMASRHTVWLYVTDYDDPTVTGTRDGKRVTAIATWRDSGVGREVRESTIVAESTRGVGVPDFTVEPADLTSTVAEGRALCFVDHLLQNFGVPDSYDLWFVQPSGANAPIRIDDHTVQIFTEGGSTPKSLYAHAWLGPNAWSEAEAWKDDWNNALSSATPPSDLYTNTNLFLTGSDYMRNLDGDTPLEGPVLGGALTSVPKDAESQLAVCYRPAASNARPLSGSVFTVGGLVRSQFWASLVGNPDTSPAGSDGVQDVTHEVTVTGQARAMYLDDRDADEDGSPDVGATNAPPFLYDDVAPPVRTLSDFATDFDSVATTGYDIPSYGLRKPTLTSVGEVMTWVDSDSDANAASFTKATVTFWTSWKDAILFGSTQQQDLAFRLRACVSDTSGTCTGPLVEATPRTASPYYACTLGTCYVHSIAGWQQHQMVIDFGSVQTVTAGFKLELQCTSGTRTRDQDCHVAFDTATFPARIDLGN